MFTKKSVKANASKGRSGESGGSGCPSIDRRGFLRGSGLAVGGLATIAATASKAAPGLPGSGLLCKAEPSAPQYYVGVEVKGTGQTDAPRTEKLFEHLAARMNGYTPSRSGPRFENPNIPAGYTYLAQMAAHDLTINSESHISLSTGAGENLRSRPLLLDTLYGQGPEISGLCYKYGPDSSGVSAHLRLDAVGKADGPSPQRDIGRLRESSGVSTVGRPLVADARNDNNAVLSQMVALFSMVHNAAADLSVRQAPDAPTFVHYKRARLATTAAYRSIIRNDLLSRLLDPQIYRHYDRSANPQRFLTTGSAENPVTREFSQAAYRIGHSMVRPFYRFNSRGESHGIAEVLTRTSAANPNETPLDRQWIAEWSRYFEVSKGQGFDSLQSSMKIGPGYSSALNNHFKRPDDGAFSGLAMRDLQRSAVSQVRKLSSLRTAIEESMPSDFPHRAWFSDTRQHTRMLIDWAQQPVPAQGFGGLFPDAMPRDLLIEFANNPPLVLFILIEAAQAPWNGERLGPLGSVIIAETFFRALDDMTSLCGSGELAEAERLVFGHGKPESMPELIVWLDRNTSSADKKLPDGDELPII